MAGYTKEDYDSLYSIRVRIWDETIQAYRRSPIRLHYHRYVMQDMVRAHWDYLVPDLGLTSTDRVVVVGSGFGWGIERLEELTGCTAVGVDISDYVHNVKGVSEDDEVRAAIVASGYDPTTGHGLEVFNVCTTQPRTKTTIINESMYTIKSRNAVKKALGNQLPTWIVTEDMLSDFTDAEVLEWVGQIDKLGVNVCHIIRESFGTNNKTLEEWNTLTGHVCISTSDHRRVG